jgi:hypothetical protein
MVGSVDWLMVTAMLEIKVKNKTTVRLDKKGIEFVHTFFSSLESDWEALASVLLEDKSFVSCLS